MPAFEAAVAKRDSFEQGTPEFKAAQEEVDRCYDFLYPAEFYFRDSYNATSVMWRLGLSWWRDVEPDIKDEDSPVNCSPGYCLKLADLIEGRTLQLITPEEFKADFDNGEDTLEGWNQYFQDKHKALVRFLRTAAHHGGMSASL
jgi:hypothetical protein